MTTTLVYIVLVVLVTFNLSMFFLFLIKKYRYRKLRPTLVDIWFSVDIAIFVTTVFIAYLTATIPKAYLVNVLNLLGLSFVLSALVVAIYFFIDVHMEEFK